MLVSMAMLFIVTSVAIYSYGCAARIRANAIALELSSHEVALLDNIFTILVQPESNGRTISDILHQCPAAKNIMRRDEVYCTTNMYYIPSAKVLEGDSVPWVITCVIDLSRGDGSLSRVSKYRRAMEEPLRYVLYSDGRIVPFRHLSDRERENLVSEMVEWVE